MLKIAGGELLLRLWSDNVTAYNSIVARGSVVYWTRRILQDKMSVTSFGIFLRGRGGQICL